MRQLTHGVHTQGAQGTKGTQVFKRGKDSCARSFHTGCSMPFCIHAHTCTYMQVHVQERVQEHVRRVCRMVTDRPTVSALALLLLLLLVPVQVHMHGVSAGSPLRGTVNFHGFHLPDSEYAVINFGPFQFWRRALALRALRVNG